jgi:hypothetical protein
MAATLAFCRWNYGSVAEEAVVASAPMFIVQKIEKRRDQRFGGPIQPEFEPTTFRFFTCFGHVSRSLIGTYIVSLRPSGYEFFPGRFLLESVGLQ